jgi:hypothetical protein
MTRQSRQRRYRGTPDQAPRIEEVRPRQGIRLPDNSIVMVPEGKSAERYARELGIQLQPRRKQPPAGLPSPDELELADDLRADGSLELADLGRTAEGHPILSQTGGASSRSSALPTVSTPSAIPRLGTGKTAASGFEQTQSDKYIPHSEVVRKHGNAFIGKLPLTKINGVNYVEKAAYEALAGRATRGSRTKQPESSGAAATASKEIAAARAARKRAWEARQKRLGR